MEIVFNGTAKEIADLAFALQDLLHETNEEEINQLVDQVVWLREHDVSRRNTQSSGGNTQVPDESGMPLEEESQLEIARSLIKELLVGAQRWGGFAKYFDRCRSFGDKYNQATEHVLKEALEVILLEIQPYEPSDEEVKQLEERSAWLKAFRGKLGDAYLGGAVNADRMNDV